MADSDTDGLTRFVASTRLLVASRLSSLAGAAALIILTSASPFIFGFVRDAWTANTAFQREALQKLNALDVSLAAGFERGNALRAADTKFAERLDRVENRVDRLVERER